MKKILGTGNALVDIVTFIENEDLLRHFSFRKGSMQLVDLSLSEKIKKAITEFKTVFSSGGSAANTIHGLAMLGTPAGFIGTIGNDGTGNFFESELKKSGVKTYLKKSHTPTGTAVALVTPDHERTFATYLGAAVELDPADLDLDVFRNYDILYIEGYLIYNIDYVNRACLIAKKLGMKIAIDLASFNVVEEKIDEFRETIKNYADIVFANREEAKAFTGAEPEEALRIISEQCDIAVVKIGAEGSYIRSGSKIIKTGTFPVKCCDTTGAGDLYAAGFLYGLAKDMPLEKCGWYGTYLAARVIEITGARIAPDLWPDIRKKISEL